MSVDFDKFDSLVNKEEINKQMQSAPDYDDVPAGTYICAIDKMEIKETKKGDGLNFFVQMGIIETVNAPKKQDKRKIFWNRKVFGNNTTDKWNDGIAIKGVISWIEALLDEGDTIEFKSYGQFADEILSVYQEICPNIHVQVAYDPDAFNPITIEDVFDI